MKRIVIATAMSLCVVSLAGCAADAKALDPNQIENSMGCPAPTPALSRRPAGRL